MGELVKFNRDRLLLLGFIVEQRERVKFSSWDSDSLVFKVIGALVYTAKHNGIMKINIQSYLDNIDTIENLLSLKESRFRSVKDALLSNMRVNSGDLLMCHYSLSDNCYLYSDGQVQLDLGSILCVEHKLETVYGHVHLNGYFIRERGIYFDVEYNPKVSVTVSQRDTKKASINGKKYKQIK